MLFILGLAIILMMLINRINGNMHFNNYDSAMNVCIAMTFAAFPITFSVVEIYLYYINRKACNLELCHNDNFKLTIYEVISLAILAAEAQIIAVLCNPYPYGFMQFNLPFGTIMYVLMMAIYVSALIVIRNNANLKDITKKRILSLMFVSLTVVFTYLNFYLVRFRLQFGKFPFDLENQVLNLIAFFPYLPFCMLIIFMREKQVKNISITSK